MKNSKTLEDFIKTYIQNVKVSSSPESYKEWLKSYGVDSRAILGESLSDIGADYERARSGFGANAERLSSLGLSSSGYSDYLSAKAYESMQKRKAGAYDKYSENEKANRSGFRDYVESALKEEESARKAENESFYRTVSDIVDAGIRDEEEAYGFALEVGLSEEKARAVAKTATDTVKRRLTEETLRYIISHGFDKDQAKQFALAQGHSEDEANVLAGYADSINSDPYLSSDYLDYLKNKENKYK